MELPISDALDGNNVSCFGGNDGKIVATVAGGILPIDFTWYEVGSVLQINQLFKATKILLRILLTT